MNRKASRGSTPRGGSRGGPARSGKRPMQQGKKAPGVAKKRAAAGAAPAAPIELPPITLGFVRGVAPSKWAERWARSVREQPLELEPVDLHEVEAARTEVDVLLERVAPGQIPPGSDESRRTRHAMRLYEETIALVVPADHEPVSYTHLDVYKRQRQHKQRLGNLQEQITMEKLGKRQDILKKLQSDMLTS